MLPSNPICPVCNYATSAVYCDLPSPEQLANGVKPLDSLPAAWWNNMWNMTNCSINQARGAIGSFITELNNVLAGAGICPNSVCTDQLYQAIDLIRQTIGNATVAGAVKSSSTPGMVSIDGNGFMTANCLGNASQLTTTAHTLVGAVNELKSTYDACTSGLTTAVNSKAPINHASSEATYGVGTATNYGHLRISNTYTSDIGDAGAAASQSALYSVYNYATQISAAAIGLGNTAGCALGTASAGSATTSARSDHVHPMPTTVSCANYLYAESAAGIYSDINGNFIHKSNQTGQYWHVDKNDGTPIFSVHFEEGYVYAPIFCGSLYGNATSATNATNATEATRIRAEAPVNYDCSLIYATMGSDDFFRLRVGGTPNSGWVTLETADDASETISVAQFTGEFTTEVRRACLLDGNGNTSFPGSVSAAGGFLGNATSATNATNACCAASLQSPNQYGVYSDEYGNMVQKTATDGANWEVKNCDNEVVFQVYFAEKYVKAATFCGDLSGNATTACGANTARTAIWSNYTAISQLNSTTENPVYYYHSNGNTYVCAKYPAFLGSSITGCVCFLGRNTSLALLAGICYPTNFYYMTSGD